ncbi:MAG TPA: type VI secretion system baseplate subunit TssG [Pyrinomonadaceae bacterium]|nr:type VI secretion system baseplate subunit TssG [Pyrinomonadaceae bacterium]
MAAYGWGKDAPLEDWLYEEPYRFDFFQAVRLLELADAARADAADEEGCTPVGEGADPFSEPVRFKSSVALSFPASDLDHLAGPPDGRARPARMTVNFMGLAGLSGPLHTPSTELIIERAWHKDTALRDFLDIFNHRLVSLLYRIRKLHRVGLDTRHPGKDRVSDYLYSVVGLGTPGLRRRMQVKDRSLLFYSGLLGQQPRSMAGLERILSDYFGVPVEGRPLQGRWRPLEEDQWTRIGERGGQNQTLGSDAVVGTRVWDQQGAFELDFGPLTLEQFEDFLPTGWAFGPACDLVRLYAGDDLDFSFRLTLKADEMRGARLGPSVGARVGWTSWLGSPADEPEAPLNIVGPFCSFPRVVGPFCRLEASGFEEDDSQVVVSPESLRAFADAVHIPYFALPPDKLMKLKARMAGRAVGANRAVVRQGDPGDSMFVITRGSVRVVRADEDGRETLLGTLRAGDCFGEVALVTGRARNASVLTLEDCEFLELKREDLDKFMDEYPRFAAALRAYAGGRMKTKKVTTDE